MSDSRGLKLLTRYITAADLVVLSVIAVSAVAGIYAINKSIEARGAEIKASYYMLDKSSWVCAKRGRIEAVDAPDPELPASSIQHYGCVAYSYNPD